MGALAYNIKIIRGISKLNQTNFAKMMDVSLSMQKSYEGERANPDPLYIQRLARLVHVKEEDLKNKKLQEKDIVQVEFVQKDQIEKDALVQRTSNSNGEIIEILKNHNSFLQRMLESNLNRLAEVQYMVLAQVQAGQKWEAKNYSKGNAKKYLEALAELSTLSGESLNAFGVMDINVPSSREGRNVP